MSRCANCGRRIKDFAIARARSMNSFATVLNIQIFTVTIPTGPG
jgi:hypothetical protein